MPQSQIIISPEGRLMAMLPHYLIISRTGGGRLQGVIKGKETRISLPQGKYTVTIRSMYKFIESTVDVSVPANATRHLTFADRDKIWNRLFNIDLALWVMKRILHVPEPWDTVYEIVSNGFFAVWLLRIWIIRKHYFEIKEVES